MKSVITLIFIFTTSSFASFTDSKNALEAKIEENIGWVKDYCGNKSLKAKVNYSQFEKLDFSKMFDSYPIKQRPEIALGNAAFISQVESVFSAIYQNCSEKEANKKVFSQIKEVQIEPVNKPADAGKCLIYNEKTGVLTAYLHYWESCKGTFLGFQIKDTFKNLGAK